MYTCERCQLYCTNQWGWQTLLSEHVYCVAIAFKMTEWAKQQICIKFCIKFEHFSTETIRMIQKAAAMGNWLLAASSRQHTRSCVMSHAEFFGKTSNHPGSSALLQPRFDNLWCLVFPKTKITFEGEEISYLQWDSEKYDGVAAGDWESYVRFQGAYFEGDWGITLYTMFLVSYLFNKCLYFSYDMAGYLLDRPRIWWKHL